MKKRSPISRRRFLKAILACGIGGTTGLTLLKPWRKKEIMAQTFIASLDDYQRDLKQAILRGLMELSFSSSEIKGKRVLLKPNLVETYHTAYDHINTHPTVIRATAECFLSLGAAEVVVAEGPGHRRDTYLVLEESGLAQVLYEDRIPFIDLNYGSVIEVKNHGDRSLLGSLVLPKELLRADFVVSIAKMKTHHWAGVTLSMKNLFGIMPGIIYGWPKNVLHWAGINESIFDINATFKPNLAIIDGIVGMEGDGPIMGAPVKSNVLVIGRNLPAVDATCARIMGINPEKIPYLRLSAGRLGPIEDRNIEQRGERIELLRKDFRLLEFIPAHRGIRL